MRVASPRILEYALGSTTVIWSLTNGYTTDTFHQTVTVQPSTSVNISVTQTGTVNTGGVSTNIYLGYGAQTALLLANVMAGTGYSYSWSPSANLIGATTQNATFAPTAAGNYTYTVTATNSNVCTVTQSVTLCVIDVNGPGNKVYLCHNGNTLCVSSNAVPAHLNHGDRLGKCNESCGSSNKNANGEEVVAYEPLVNKEVNVYPNLLMATLW